MSNPSDRPDDPSSYDDPAEVLEYSRSRRFLRKISIWTGGFLVEGKVLHGYSERDLRRVDLTGVLYNLLGIVTLVGLVYWFAFVVPRGIAGLIVGIPLGVVAIRMSLFGSITVTAWVVAAVDDVINQRYGPEWD